MRKTLETEKPKVLLPSHGQQIHPAVKAWLDNVIIPALVKQYIAANGVGNEDQGVDIESQKRKTQT